MIEVVSVYPSTLQQESLKVSLTLYYANTSCRLVCYVTSEYCMDGDVTSGNAAKSVT